MGKFSIQSLSQVDRINGYIQTMQNWKAMIKQVDHFKKKTFADNLLTPMSSKISMSFFLQLKRK